MTPETTTTIVHIPASTVKTDSKVGHKLRRVFVWELPVRIYHWLNAAVIIVLIATGFFIANPLALQSNREPSQQFLMGWIRMIHFIAAYVFFFNFLFRIYWGFVGNKYSNWKQFIPTSRKFFKEMWHVFKMDILMLRGKEHMSVGHNAMAGIIYFFTFLAFLVQCLTGFGLYASMSTSWWFPKMFKWVPAMFGGDIFLRQVHHWTMWFFILFAIIHVYLVFYHDYVEGRGEISSMGGGWKFVEEEVFTENKELPNEPRKK
jgi:Ni/Fe-hydrogenase 1 B-type cytochrome subunit